MTPPLDPPAHLDAIASDEWCRLVDRLAQLGRLAELDPTELEVRCLALSRLRHATESMGREFSYLHGKLRKPKPEMAVITSAERTIRAFDARFNRPAKKEG